MRLRRGLIIFKVIFVIFIISKNLFLYNFLVINNKNLDRRNSSNWKISRINNHNFNQSTADELKLSYSTCDAAMSLLCCFNICKSQVLIHKDNQYKLSIDTLKDYMNLNFIIRKLREIEFMKRVFLQREQAMAFNFFGKPLISEKMHYSRAANKIHYDQYLTNKDDQITSIKNYLTEEAKKEQFSGSDLKIAELLKIDL